MTNDRLPPQDMDAEMALIGSLMVQPHQLDEVLTIIGGSEVFALPPHSVIFDTLVDMCRSEKAVDLLTLTAALRGVGRLESVGGQEYMIDLAGSFADPANAEHYAHLVLTMWKRRELIRLANRLESSAHDPLSVPDDVAAEHAARVEAVATRAQEKQVEEATVLVGQTLAALESDNSPVGHIETGLLGFDSEVGGLPKGNLTILAACPSVGKTAMSLGWALQAKWAGIPTLFVSVEMGRMQLAMRLVNMLTGATFRDQEYPDPPERRRRDYAEATRMLSDTDLHITDCTKEIGRIVALGRAHARMRGVGLIVVDYLQLCSMRGTFGTTNDKTTSMIHALKGLATDTGTAVVVLSQFSRDVAKTNREPQMSDLRDSGSIEQDADLILLLAAKPCRGQEHDPERDILMLAAKNRNGPTGRYSLVFDKRTMVFRSGVM